MQHRNPVVERSIKEFFDYLGTRKSYTKDIKDLKFDYGDIIPLFVYDGLMRGHDDDHVLQECHYFGHATTSDDEWILMQKDYGPAGMFPQTTQSLKYEYNLPVNNFRRIQGDLFGVPLDVLCYLDVKMGNGELYNRSDIPVMLHQFERCTTSIKHAQVYIADYNRWKSPQGSNHKKLHTSPIVLSSHLNQRVYHAFDKVKTVMPTKEITPVEHSSYNSALWEELQDDLWP